MTAHRRPNFAFTLIELILVLVIMSIMLALASPSLRGWGQGQKLRNAADDFVAATGYARTEAVARCKPYAVQIDGKANTYVVQSVEADLSRKAVDGSRGRPAELPTDFTIAVISGGSQGAAVDGQSDSGTASIVFYPDARLTPAVVELKAPNGDVARVASDAPSQPFKRTEQAQ